MSNSRIFTDASKLLSPYIEAPGRHSLTAELIRVGSDPVAAAGETSPPDGEIEKLSMELYEVIDGGISIRKFIEKLDHFTEPGPAEYVRQFIRISTPGGPDDQNIQKTSRDAACYLNDLRN